MSVLYAILTVLHVFVCFILIIMVLLQAGKGGGMSGLFGGSGGDSIFGGQGPTKPLAILTEICAGLFMVTCISLSMMTKSTGPQSVIQNTPVQQQAPRPTQAPPSQAPVPAKPASSTPVQQPTNSK